MTNIFLAISLFLFIQIVLLGYMASETEDADYWEYVNTPFSACVNFIKAFPFFIAEANSIVVLAEETNIIGNNNLTINTNKVLDNYSNLDNYTNLNNKNIDESTSSIIIY